MKGGAEHDFSYDTEHVRFCVRCARPETNALRRQPCVPLAYPMPVLARRLGHLKVLLGAIQGGKGRGRHSKKGLKK